MAVLVPFPLVVRFDVGKLLVGEGLIAHWLVVLWSTADSGRVGLPLTPRIAPAWRRRSWPQQRGRVRGTVGFDLGRRGCLEISGVVSEARQHRHARPRKSRHQDLRRASRPSAFCVVHIHGDP